MAEIWHPIPCAPTVHVSSLGRFRNTETGNLLAPRLRKDGYLHLAIRYGGERFHKKAHQYVAAAFLGPKPFEGAQVAHADGTRTNNTPENLRWVTCKENHADREKHGRAPKGARNGRSRLRDSEVLRIRELLSAGLTQNDIADQFNVCASTISHINTRKYWSHL
ncbi:HNH endonuclease [Hoeflea algicola]|uniref:HNH endonuclease n=1 Tax=Hoeflea algicola TaxID=2983763 RepID=UPI003CE4C4F2